LFVAGGTVVSPRSGEILLDTAPMSMGRDGQWCGDINAIVAYEAGHMKAEIQ